MVLSVIALLRSRPGRWKPQPPGPPPDHGWGSQSAKAIGESDLTLHAIRAFKNRVATLCSGRSLSFMDRRKGPPMQAPRVKYILSPSEIPAGQNYVLVRYGEKYEQTRQALGVTITVARQQSKTVSELSFLTAVHTAKGLGKREGISEIFACK